MISESDSARWTFDGKAIPSITFSDPSRQGKDVLEWVALKQELLGVVEDYNVLLQVSDLAGRPNHLEGVDMKRADRVLAKAVSLLDGAADDPDKRTSRRANEIRRRLRDAEAALRLRSLFHSYKHNAAWMFTTNKRAWQEVALLVDKAASMVYHPNLWNLSRRPISEPTLRLLQAVLEKMHTARNPINRNKNILDKVRADLRRFGTSLAADIRGSSIDERSIMPTVLGEE